MVFEAYAVGSFVINGEEQDDEIKIVTLTGSRSISIRLMKKRISFSFSLFNVNLFSIPEGFLHLEGKNIAYIQKGPLGHPGDGEYEHRCVDKLTINYSFTSQKLVIEFFCTTKLGCITRAKNSPVLPPSEIEIKFELEKAYLKEFLELSDSAWGYFTESLNEIENT